MVDMEPATQRRTGPQNTELRRLMSWSERGGRSNASGRLDVFVHDSRLPSSPDGESPLDRVSRFQQRSLSNPNSLSAKVVPSFRPCRKHCCPLFHWQILGLLIGRRAPPMRRGADLRSTSRPSEAPVPKPFGRWTDMRVRGLVLSRPRRSSMLTRRICVLKIPAIPAAMSKSGDVARPGASQSVG